MSSSIDVTAGAITASSVAVARSDLTSVAVDDETVLYDGRARALHRLSPTATVVWACLDGSGTLAEIAADMADAYGADPGRVCTDVVATVRGLGARGLLVGVRPADPGPAGQHQPAPEISGPDGPPSAGRESDPFVAEPPGT